MALSGCTYMEHATVAKDNGFFKEDALAHEELFDGEEISEIKLRSPLRSVAADMAEPLLGVQYSAKYENDVGSGNWFVAVRFLAAVKSLDVNATWTRTVYKDDGDVYGSKGATKNIATTKAYEYVNSESTPINANSWAKANYGAGEGEYTHFVVLCLYDIPFGSNDNYSAVAHLKISDNSGSLTDVYSKDIAARIGGGAVAQFASDRTDGYFLKGKINGVENTELNADAETKGTDPNRASFSSNFAAEDAFVIVNKDYAHSKFQIWGSSCLSYYDNGSILTHFQNSDGKIGVKTAGNYVLYLNDSENAQLWHSVVRKIYVSLEWVSWWTDDSAWTAIYAFGSAGNRWYKLDTSGSYLVTKVAIDPSQYNTIIVVRMKSGSSEKEENALSWDDKYGNQTNNATIPSENADCIRVWDGEEGGNKKFDWIERAA